MNNKIKKTIKISVGIVIMVSLVFVIITKTGSENNAEESAKTITLNRADITESISASGRVESASHVNVSAVKDGSKVKKVYVKVGDQVKEGDMLAQLDTADLQREIETKTLNLNTEIESAKQDMELKYRNLSNSKVLFEQGAISKDDLLKAESEYNRSAADYNTKKNSSEVNSLERQIAESAIRATADGTVTMVNAEEGSFANGVLFTIEDLGNLKIRAGVSEYDINSVRIGQKVVIKTEMTEDKEFTGEIYNIPPTSQKDDTGKAVKDGKVLFDVEVLFKNNQDIKAGTNARINIITAEKQGVIAVPPDALLKNQDGSNSIYIADQSGEDYVVKEIKVEKGLENDFNAEIQGDGIQEGVKVLSSPKNFVTGQKIKVQ